MVKLEKVLSDLEGEIYDTMQYIEETFGIESQEAVDIVRDFLKEKF